MDRGEDISLTRFYVQGKLVSSCINLCLEYYMKLDPWTSKSDQHLVSPYNLTPESHIKVMRIKEMITDQTKALDY